MTGFLINHLIMQRQWLYHTQLVYRGSIVFRRPVRPSVHRLYLQSLNTTSLNPVIGIQWKFEGFLSKSWHCIPSFNFFDLNGFWGLPYRTMDYATSIIWTGRFPICNSSETSTIKWISMKLSEDFVLINVIVY